MHHVDFFLELDWKRGSSGATIMSPEPDTLQKYNRHGQQSHLDSDSQILHRSAPLKIFPPNSFRKA